MKRFLLPLLLLILPQILFAQISKKEQNEELRRNAKEIQWQEHIETPTFISFRDDYNLTPEQAVEYSKSFCSAENVDFTLINQHLSKDGKHFYRYVQTIGGYPVEFSSWHVHEKNGKVIAVNGDIVDIQDMDLNFSITEEEALQAALKYIGAEFYMWMDEGEEQNLKLLLDDETATYYPEGVKIITPVQPDIKMNKLKTAYKFNIYSKKPFDRKMVYVDAQTGEILFDLPLIHFENAVGTAHTQYSGIKEINTFNNGSQYILQDNTRGNGIKTLNCHNTYNYYSATNFFDDDNIWNNVNPQKDEYATDAHFSTMSTYDYYLNVHNRNSINNNGFALTSYVHFDLIGYGYSDNVNAFWNGQYMTYGDGSASQGITPLTTIDICGHEISHGLTTFTANLTYSYESGALNEAYSDIFGTAIEFYAVPEYANWTMGEKIGGIFRSMSNPKQYGQPNTYKGSYWYTGSNDNGGVHTNSGVLNYWFYLLCEGGSGVNDKGNAYEVQGIGIEKAEKIAFKTLTEYLSAGSQYINAYNYSVIAAGELFGGCSQEVQSVGDAFYAVGVINTPFVSITTADFKASQTVICSAPAQVKFSNKSTNGITYLWDFGDGATSTETNPTHTYTEEGEYTVTLSVDGGVCGSDMIVKEDYIKIDGSYLCAFNMPSQGTITKESCGGVFFDPGGPTGNYPSSANSKLTIYAPGATGIVLTIEEFDIEPGSGSSCNYDYIAFYNGNSTSAPIIGTKYCNTTGNPGTITATGEYVTIHFSSDGYQQHAGYMISFHCILPLSPEAKFEVNKNATCTGIVEFTDKSTSKPVEWLWNFGDGETSDLKNPVHQYIQNGTYTVSLTVTNEFGIDTLEKENLITVEFPEAPVIEDTRVCAGRPFEIVLELEGIAYWYEDSASEYPIYIGNIWEHPGIDENTLYFVREVFENADEVCVSPFTEVQIYADLCEGVNQNYMENVKITPNPTTGELRMENGELRIDNVEIFDVYGRKLSQVSNLKSQISYQMNITELSAGVYFVKISTELGATVKKVVKL